MILRPQYIDSNSNTRFRQSLGHHACAWLLVQLELNVTPCENVEFHHYHLI